MDTSRRSVSTFASDPRDSAPAPVACAPARSLLACLIAATVAIVTAPGASHAHDADLAIGGTKISIKGGSSPAKRKLKFSTKKQLPISIAHDPSQVPTWILLRGYGVDGGTSGRIDLDSTLWKTLGPASSPKGYKYSDRDGTRGGVKKALLKPGKLVLSAGGASWPWDPAGPQATVWVHFGIEDETYCASFGGVIKSNDAGVFQAKGAISPGNCLAAVCSNGKVELGEECDDGNLIENDGCTSFCATGECVGDSYDSTFEAIQTLVFEQNGCNSMLCHGATPGQGGLELSPLVAYANMLQVPSVGSTFERIVPASPTSSSLYLKLLKTVDPLTDIPGDGMPSGLPPIHDDLLEAVRIWILAGAPETGTVSGTETLLGGCFPDPVPISIEPLAPPDPAAGFQLEMPSTPLSAQTEIEVCYATYYDMTSVVPAQYQDPTGEFFYTNADITRQDPHSHHLVIMRSNVSEQLVNDASFGGWTCVDGPMEGSSCDPIDTGSCGTGFCRSAIGNNIACIGYGPPGGPTAANPANGIGGAGNGQTSFELPDGVYSKVPLKGFVYWNAHAFNLTSLDHELKAYLNLLYTDNLVHEMEQFTDIHDIYIAAGQPPYTKATYCSSKTFAVGTRLFILSSHTHQRGEVFWVDDSQGTEIYRSFIYNDPVIKEFDPPLAFDSPNAADRTLTYCATYNNGVAPDGTPDPATVRKRSVTPQNAFPCNPTGCTTGNVGGACNGANDHATCDSSPGAGDGTCDACAITLGVSTEDEMFVLTGRSYQGP